jgi:hypothetical protein
MKQLWRRLSRQRSLVVVARRWRLGRFPWCSLECRRQAPPGPSAGLDAVSCTSCSGCIAVGEGHAFAVAERWNGTKWTAMAMPRLSGSEGALLGIACISASNCIAVGRYTSLTR